MTITSILFYAAMRDRLGRGRVLRAVLLFLVFDVAFLASNALKIEHGGWFPIVTALGIFTIMTTWNRGRLALGAYVMALARPLAAFMEEIQRNPPVRVKGTAIFMTANPGVAPPVLLHHLKHNQVLHERVILLTIVSEGVPEIAPAKRLVVHDKGAGLVHITAHYGFMQSPNVPEILERCAEHGIRTQPQTTTFYLGRETLLATGTSKLARWRKRLFAFLSRNSRPPTDFFQIPPDRVVEMGMQVQL